MTDRWPESIRVDMEALSALVLYRTPDGWRYAIYANGIMDGRLPELPPTVDEVEAQGALIALIEAGTGKRVDSSWTSEKEGWWTADAELK